LNWIDKAVHSFVTFTTFVNMSREDKVLGVLFGEAIGDALGLGTEFMTKDEVLKHYPNGLTSYDQIIEDYHRMRWHKGMWTDDTEQMLCIAKAIIKDKAINPLTIAGEFYKWFKGNPMGIGRHTYQVLGFPEYTTYPEKAAQMVWEMGRCKSAANGALMRTSILGLFDDVEANAERVCKLTHADPRCVGSCVIVSTIINRLVNNKSISFDEIIQIGNKYDNRIEEYIILAQSDDISALQLDDKETQGYTLKTLAAGLWALFHCDSFEEGLLAIVHEGGDADTNAAVACSILGAKFGFSNIPEQYINGLRHKDYLISMASELICIKTNQN